MQDQAGFNLGCTANDVQIASATILTIDDPCQFPGDSVTFTAEFDVVVTAKERYDLGLYFAIDGDPNTDGAISGTCSISTIDPAAVDRNGESQFVDLDASGVSGDVCGDITKASNPLQPVITITTECVDSDGDGFLNLPNCTSWRQSGANELCTSPTDAFPGSPSKCRCDPTFQVPVPVPPGTITVTKTASPTETTEPSGLITFDVTVRNDSIDPNNPVIVDTLTDSVHGNLNGQGSCFVPQTIGALQTYSCSFTATVSGNAGYIETDTVTASGVDSRTPPNPVSDSDDAVVTITDELPALSLVKTANPETVPEPGGNVQFTVAVTNDSNLEDPVTITSLTDQRPIPGGPIIDLNGQGDCSVPQTIQPGDTYTCTFTAFVGTNYKDSETDTVTASGTDDEGNAVSASNSATVMITNTPSEVILIKTANPTSVDEPGGDVTFSFTVNNNSAVDTVTIDSLTDTIYGDLDGLGSCAVPQVITAGGSYGCSFTIFVDGNGNTAHTNVATAAGVDDDGMPVEDMDDATVNVNNVAPNAAVTKIVTSTVVTYKVTIDNTSVSTDDLTLTHLDDDPYGNLLGPNADISNNTCQGLTGTVIPAGDSISCSFDAVIDSPDGTATVTDTVTGQLADDEATGVDPDPSDSATVTIQ